MVGGYHGPMKTKTGNLLLTLTLPLLVLACSKTETSDMMFKKAVSEVTSTSAAPVPGIESSEVPPSEATPSEAPNATGPVDAGQTEESNTVITNSNPPQTPPTESVTQTPPTENVTQTPPTESVTQTPPTNSVTNTVIPPVVETYVPYPESVTKSCKLTLTFNGLGSANKVVIASASKTDLLARDFDGFEDLSNADLASMRSVVDRATSSSSVKFASSDVTYSKNDFPSDVVMVVVDGSAARSISFDGMGKDAQIHVMGVASEHNTVCVRNNGNSFASEFALSVIGDEKFVSRGQVNVNGSSSVRSLVKVVGGHQTGSSFDGNGFKDSQLSFITQGKNDTFTSLSGNAVENCQFDVKIKGKNDTGWGMDILSLSHSKLHLEIEGQENVNALMLIKNRMEDNDFSGWLKAKADGKVDDRIANYIEIMPLS